MEFFKIRSDIPFMRHALVLNGISLLTFLAAVFFLFSKGLHLSVEFTGGALMEVSYSQPADLERVRGSIAALGINDVQVQNFGTAQEVLIRMPVQKGSDAAAQSEKVFAALKAADASANLRRTEFVGPQVGDELAVDGLKALACVVVGIMLYLAIRFEWKFAVAAIIANLHDVIIILGFFAFFQWEFSLPVLAAVLGSRCGIHATGGAHSAHESLWQVGPKHSPNASTLGIDQCAINGINFDPGCPGKFQAGAGINELRHQ